VKTYCPRKKGDCGTEDTIPETSLEIKGDEENPDLRESKEGKSTGQKNRNSPAGAVCGKIPPSGGNNRVYGVWGNHNGKREGGEKSATYSTKRGCPWGRETKTSWENGRWQRNR